MALQNVFGDLSLEATQVIVKDALVSIQSIENTQKDTLETISGLVDEIRRLAKSVEAIVSARGFASDIRVTPVGGSVGSISTVSTVSNISSIGGLNAIQHIPSTQNTAACIGNVNNILRS